MNSIKQPIIHVSAIASLATAVVFLLNGCDIGGLDSYSNQWLHPENISTVYVEMFDSQSFRRRHEYDLTDAVCKRIEAQTPYKIVSDRDLADSVLSGQLSIYAGVLAWERYEGVPLEMETTAVVSVSWKNLKTGDLMINNEQVMASASYSEQLDQTFDYAASMAVNRAATRVVELMEVPW
ncbi:MAG: hypothetical protein JW828_03780 [Sedimentisphaerales bacterium]|nr:hypothetical protein [Sedimentisphaerales bacterium]